MSKQKDPKLQERLSNLKKKQDHWLKERSRSMSGTTQNTPKDVKTTLKSSVRTTPVRPSLNGNIKAKPDTMLWNTGPKTSSSYSGFVVRKRSSSSDTNKSKNSGGDTNKSKCSGGDTNRSKQSVLSHSSLKNRELVRSISTKTEDKFIKSASKKYNKIANHAEVKKEAETLSLKMDDYFSKLDIKEENYDHKKYEFENNYHADRSMFLFENTIDEHSFTRKQDDGFMRNHFCILCQQVMINKQKCSSDCLSMWSFVLSFMYKWTKILPFM